MIDPGSFVDAESSDVGSILTEMTRLVIDRDGALHPGLRMVERSGELTVFCSDHAGTATDQPLFDVPRELLIPMDGAAWVASDQMLVLAEPLTFTDGQSERSFRVVQSGRKTILRRMNDGMGVKISKLMSRAWTIVPAPTAPSAP